MVAVMDPVPDLDDLTWLFESAPVGRYESEDWRREWPYGAVTFSTVRQEVEIDFYLEPASQLAGLSIRGDHTLKVRLDLSGVQRINVERLHDAEELVVAFDVSRSTAPMRLTLKPQLHLTWGNAESWNPPES
jgi:hypothetical protein